MLPPQSILLYGWDERLLETRRLVLERAGFQVWTVKSLADAEKLIAAHPPALLLLCHSLSVRDCEKALEMAHLLLPTMKCLVLTAGTPVCKLSEGDEVYSAFEGPGNLVAMIERLLKPDDRRTPALAFDIGALQESHESPSKNTTPPPRKLCRIGDISAEVCITNH